MTADVVVRIRVPHGWASVNQTLIGRVRASLGIPSWEGAHPLHEHLKRHDAARRRARITLHRRTA